MMESVVWDLAMGEGCPSYTTYYQPNRVSLSSNRSSVGLICPSFALWMPGRILDLTASCWFLFSWIYAESDAGFLAPVFEERGAFSAERFESPLALVRLPKQYAEPRKDQSRAI